MGHATEDGWCDCEPPPNMAEAQRIGAQFGAQILGGIVCFGPPPPDSMLAWLQAQTNPTHADIAAERARRGIVIDKDD